MSRLSYVLTPLMVICGNMALSRRGLMTVLSKRTAASGWVDVVFEARPAPMLHNLPLLNSAVRLMGAQMVQQKADNSSMRDPRANAGEADSAPNLNCLHFSHLQRIIFSIYRLQRPLMG
jgi:hypothetical protein